MHCLLFFSGNFSLREEKFFTEESFPVTCTTVAYVCHITDIFIITEFSQKLFDIEVLYKYCKVTPAHQPIKVVLKTAVRSIEYS